MKFIIALADLEALLKGAGVTRPRKSETLTLSACAARVFVEYRGEVAGIEMLVLSDGAVALPAQKFLALIKTYKGTRFLDLEGGPQGLKIKTLTVPILAWNPTPTPPGEFRLFPVSRALEIASPTTGRSR